MPSLVNTQTPDYKTEFIQSCISASVLTFGTYKLKSGRESPYFFNAGLFHTASLVRVISTAFAKTLVDYQKSKRDFHFDVLFGPAYKGIPLAATTAVMLAQLNETAFGDVGYSHNRKEVKDHGEGGVIVGTPLKGMRVVIIDDVITAGTAMREAINIIQKQGGELVGVLVAFDRMEKMSDESSGSAIGEVQKEFGVPVLSIIDLNDLVSHLRGLGDEQDMKRLEEYQMRYGASD